MLTKRNLGAVVLAVAVMLSQSSAADADVESVDASATVTRQAKRVPATAGTLVAVGGTERLECSWSVATVAAAPKTGGSLGEGDGVTAVYVGYSERPGGARVAVAMHIEDGEKQWCNDRLALSSEPTNGSGILWDLEDRLLLVVTASSDITGDLADAAADGWLANFSDRNAGSRPAKSVVLATVDIATGQTIAATFLTAQQQRSFQPADVVVSDIDFEGSAYRVETQSIEPPRRADGSTFDCPVVFPYEATYVFRADLASPMIAASPGCF